MSNHGPRRSEARQRGGQAATSLWPAAQTLLRFLLGASIAVHGATLLLGIDFAIAEIVPHGAHLAVLFLARPAQLLLGALLLAILSERFARRAVPVGWLLIAGSVVGLVGLWSLRSAAQNPWLDLTALLGDAATDVGRLLLIGAPLVVISRLWKGRRGPRHLTRLPYVAGGVLSLVLASTCPDDGLTTNRFGLVAASPDSTETVRYDDHPNKDGYPSCVFDYNSLGYRDREPPSEESSRQPVLLVGDSFVWGDGIPALDQTLGGLLQAELDRRSTGSYHVVNAGWPGNGVYGYSRVVQELEPALEPVAVVIGYLGDADYDPLDSQRLADFATRRGPLGGMIAGLGVLQHAHVSSVRNSAKLWSTAATRRGVAASWERMRPAPNGRRRCSLIIDYLHSPGRQSYLPKGWQVLRLTEPHRFAATSNAYWYGLDFHPRPALNQVLAGELATKLRRCLGASDNRGSAGNSGVEKGAGP